MPLSGSPQSTLAELTTWDLSSSGGSSSGNISSGVTSPTTPSVETPHTRADDDTMYLLYSELLRLKVEEEIKVREQQLMQLKQQQHYQQLMWKMRQAQLSSLMTDKMEPPNYEHEFVQYPSVQNSSTQQPASCTSEHYRSDVRSRSDFSQKHGLGREYEHLRLQNARINVPQRNWEQCSLRGDVHQPNPQYNVARMHNLHGGQYNGYKTQQTNRSGLRAVFLGIPGARGSEGTGVFLPRRVGGCSESKRRPACSTVLLPSRIVQALKLNVEDTLVCPSNPRSASFPKPDISTSSVRVRSSPVCTDAVSGPEEWSLHTAGAGNSVCSSLQEVAPNVCLPTEWTY
ncbi:hypothetical protein KP509_15G049000 [Ceratopteris richardii]|nr:hypothetical protein KP509_15G049000 [Ceratopteris richardii]